MKETHQVHPPGPTESFVSLFSAAHFLGKLALPSIPSLIRLLEQEAGKRFLINSREGSALTTVPSTVRGLVITTPETREPGFRKAKPRACPQPGGQMGQSRPWLHDCSLLSCPLLESLEGRQTPQTPLRGAGSPPRPFSIGDSEPHP